MAARKKVRSKGRAEEIRENIEERNIFFRRLVLLLRKPKIFVPLILIILGVAAFYAKGLFIAAIVNGQPITRLALVKELEKRNGEQTLSSIITETLILQEAEKRGVSVTQEELNDSVKKIEDQLKKQGQNLDQGLVFQGMTRKDFENQLRLKILVEKMLADEIEPKEEEVKDYIEKNKDTLPKDLTDEEEEQTVIERLRQQNLSNKVQKWLADLQKNATINYFVNY